MGMYNGRGKLPNHASRGPRLRQEISGERRLAGKRTAHGFGHRARVCQRFPATRGVAKAVHANAVENLSRRQTGGRRCDNLHLYVVRCERLCQQE